MNKNKVSYDVDELISVLRKQIKNCCGFDTFITLVENKGESIHCTRLRHLGTIPGGNTSEFDTFSTRLPDYIFTDHSIPEMPIPCLDNRAFIQAKAAYLIILDREQEALSNNDYAKADDCREEREKYEDYFSLAVTKKGKIRNIEDQTREDYRLIKNNLINFLKKVEAINPDYAEYIKAHLHIGYTMEWQE